MRWTSLPLSLSVKKSSPILVGFIHRNPSEPANWVDKLFV